LRDVQDVKHTAHDTCVMGSRQQAATAAQQASTARPPSERCPHLLDGCGHHRRLCGGPGQRLQLGHDLTQGGVGGDGGDALCGTQQGCSVRWQAWALRGARPIVSSPVAAGHAPFAYSPRQSSQSATAAWASTWSSCGASCSGGRSGS
jgi:hypothetical protein